MAPVWNTFCADSNINNETKIALFSSCQLTVEVDLTENIVTMFSLILHLLLLITFCCQSLSSEVLLYGTPLAFFQDFIEELRLDNIMVITDKKHGKNKLRNKTPPIHIYPRSRNQMVLKTDDFVYINRRKANVRCNFPSQVKIFF